MRISNRV